MLRRFKITRKKVEYNFIPNGPHQNDKEKKEEKKKKKYANSNDYIILVLPSMRNILRTFKSIF